MNTIKAYWLYLRALCGHRPWTFFRMAADLGHAESQYRYALFEDNYEAEFYDSTRSLAFTYMSLAADQGHKRATLWLDKRIRHR